MASYRPHIEDKNVLLALALLVQTVRDGSRGGLVDDTEHVESANGSSVLSGLTLGVVEISGDGDNGIVHRGTEVCLSGLLHLRQDHRGDLFGVESLLLALVVDGDQGLVAGSGGNLEKIYLG